MNKIEKLFINNIDLCYKEFSSRIISNVDDKKILGVRIPIIRKIAKSISEEDKKIFISELPHKYHEENLLHGFLISINKDIDNTIKELNDFLPYVDNWAVSDTISPKSFKKDLNKAYKQIKIWIKSDKVYTKRFAIVSLLQFYLDKEFKEEYNLLVLKVNSDEYYVNMAIAWYFSFALIKQYEKTITIFENKRLDKWVHNKSIQKAIESYRISNERKNYLKSLKIK